VTSDADDIAKVKEHVSSINYLWPFKLSLQNWRHGKIGGRGQFLLKSIDPYSFTKCTLRGEVCSRLIKPTTQVYLGNVRLLTVSNLIHQTLRANSTTQIMRYIHIGLLCVQAKVAERPTMASVRLMLSSHSITLSVPTKSLFLMYAALDQTCQPNRKIG
jgi:hypothetical protein